MGVFFLKLGHSLWVGLMMGAMMSVFATLIIARLKLARTLRQAFRLGLAAGAVVGVVFIGVSLFT
jgi:hypothetical protein